MSTQDQQSPHHLQPRPAIFLDRDDTINRNADLPDPAWEGVKWGDLLKPEFALLIPGVTQALLALKEIGYTLVVITNQGGVAREGGTMRDVDACNDRMRSLLHHPDDQPNPEPDHLALFDDQLIDCWYSCPFHPETGTLPHLSVEHEWRKPHPGMVIAACRELNLDPSRSWMIGDKQRDLDAAISAGVPQSQTIQVGPKSSCPDLAHAASMILQIQEPLSSPTDPTQPQSSTSTATLHSIHLNDYPLEDDRVRALVESAARAIAERTGIKLIELNTTESEIRATLEIHKLGAIAFMAQLRTDTNNWYRAQHGINLWKSPNNEFGDNPR